MVLHEEIPKAAARLPHSKAQTVSLCHRRDTRRYKLPAGEALEVGHLALHFLARGVGSGADALDAQLEFVGVGSARQSFVDGDELLGVEIEERLIESLHAVLAGAGG